ncbi:hypothetical protein DFQ27_008283 [Actinomortierella ambigua]|uniref:ENTH domain-containing protein n=1 Tax=Actinomortierella ambigua TaxID=1343610 RepID=A0A9P6QJ54_9FUNG|nr:hypothetical protein DFQ26_004102 [Actinomortierella ambigua]KAG0267784.1 hypothetical protein DFQ27_008283 [Actinomortierella ambigua]
MSTPKYAAKSAARQLKNFTKGYTEWQAKVREATSNDPWGPSGTQMNELAQATYHQQEFIEIMEILDKRLNDKGANWRHVFKALTVLDYLLHVGSENVVRYAKENLYIVKTLKEFQYIDAEGKDQGANVRQKAKDITALLSDDARLREERQSRTAMRDRMRGRTGDYERTTPVYERPGGNEEERDLQRALEESKRMAQEQEARQRTSEDELQLALEISKREEQDRLHSVETFNELSLSEEWEAPASGVNQYQQQQQQEQNNIDFFGNDFGSNGNNMFGNGNQNNFDAFGSTNMFDNNNNNFMQAQPTGFNNPYLQLQQQQMQQQMLAQQQFAQQQFLQQQALQQQQQAFLGAMNNPYQQQMMPQITGAPPSTGGSNNPFSAFAQKQPQQSTDLFSSGSNTLNNNNNMNGMNGFGGSSSNFNKPNNDVSSLGDLAFLQTSSPASQPSTQASEQARKPNANDEKYAHLAMALANRDEDGIDSFGNTGTLRIPAHHGLALNGGGRSANPFQMGKSNESNSLIDIGDGSSSNGFGAQPTGSRNPFQQAAAGGNSTSPFSTQRGLGAFGANPPNNPHTPASTFQSNGAYSNNTLF